jgi:hypothetical protein
MKEQIIQSANILFEINKIYDHTSVKEFLINVKSSITNPAAFTYNRWNKGMQEICELFEHVGRSSYKYLGPKEISKYSGGVFHFPQGISKIHKIGNWQDGVFNFINPNIQNFPEWKKSEDNGIESVDVDSIITFESIDGSLIQTKALTDEAVNAGKSNGTYMYILSDSNLGKLLINKCLGDKFKFGTTEYKIIKIH